MRVFAAFCAVISAAGLALGGLSLGVTTLDRYPIPILYFLSAALLLMFMLARSYHVERKMAVVVFSALALASAVLLSMLPEYMTVLNIHGVVHRSVVSALLLLAIAAPSLSFSLFYLLRATPRAYDLSRYPLIALPMVLISAAYVFILSRLISDGAPHLNWTVLSTPFKVQSWDSVVWQNGWPVWITNSVKQIGMRNQILGTLLLMGLTSVISLPIGVGVGVYVHQYAGKRLAGFVNFSTTLLRSVSAIVLVVTALSITRIVTSSLPGTTLNYIVNGFGYFGIGTLVTGRSSFLFASVFISLLVIPIIANATQEGLRSLPSDIKEGSLAVGASPEHTLTHISLPWALPNITTGLILGCAEAAGSLAMIFLISGTGELGVSPLNETTSLAYFIFECRYGKMMGDSIQTFMESYQYSAALLLLIITLGLTVAALIVKRHLVKRYKGA